MGTNEMNPREETVLLPVPGELLEEAGLVFPDSWNITVTDKAGKTVYDRTFTAADFTTDDNGDCRLNKISVTGLTGGGNMTMTIHNAPVPADLEILKTSEDGKVAGITFTVEEWAPGIGYCRIGAVHHRQPGRHIRTQSTGGNQIPDHRDGAGGLCESGAQGDHHPGGNQYRHL